MRAVRVWDMGAALDRADTEAVDPRTRRVAGVAEAGRRVVVVVHKIEVVHRAAHRTRSAAVVKPKVAEAGESSHRA